MQANVGGYISVGTNDLEAAKKFYDHVFEPIEHKSFKGNDRSYFYYFTNTDTYFAVFTPFDGEPATVGNGSMMGIRFSSPSEVDEVFKRAIEAGGKDDGSPEQKVETFYGGYVRDLDGNKLVFVKWANRRYGNCIFFSFTWLGFISSASCAKSFSRHLFIVSE